MANTDELHHDIEAARRSVQHDIAMIDAQVRAEREAASARMHDNAVYLAAGAAGLGVLIGFAGKKGLKALLLTGAVAGAAAYYLKQQRAAANGS